MKTFTKSALALLAAAFATQAAADITLYQAEEFSGRAYTNRDPRVENIGELAASVSITDNQVWEVCEDTNFRGRCVRLMPGNYPTLSSMTMRSRIASVRMVDRDARAGDGRDYRGDYRGENRGDYRGDGRDYRRRSGERLYEADVVSVRAIMGANEQRCWVDREQVGSRPNPAGTVVGAVIGGILGHQLGHGSNRTGATVGGAVVGGAVGSSVDRRPAYADVQRCTTVPSTAAPAFWDVTYIFRGQEHHVQMSAPPGARIMVNAYGEPRA
jgi:uncharacterized protein YcfJ